MGEQQYKAVMAVLGDGRTATEVPGTGRWAGRLDEDAITGSRSEAQRVLI